eukprot:5538140-Pyramimonas_sp.AAC.1
MGQPVRAAEQPARADEWASSLTGAAVGPPGGKPFDRLPRREGALPTAPILQRPAPPEAGARPA